MEPINKAMVQFYKQLSKITKYYWLPTQNTY